MSRRRLTSIAGDRDPQQLARNVRRVRDALGWSGRRLCAEAGISPQTLASVEGGRGCTLAVERKLCGAMGSVVGRLWEVYEPDRQVLRLPETDRWYFADAADGERFRDRHSLGRPEGEEPPPLRLDPDAIQDEAERARMGEGGLSIGFVRVTTAYLTRAAIVSSVLEPYGRIHGNIPDGHLAYFQTVRGAIRFRVGERLHEMTEGAVLQAEMSSPAWIEPLHLLERGEPPPRLAFVDLSVRIHAHPAKAG